jgi:hypothetical protein
MWLFPNLREGREVRTRLEEEEGEAVVGGRNRVNDGPRSDEEAVDEGRSQLVCSTREKKGRGRKTYINPSDPRSDNPSQTRNPGPINRCMNVLISLDDSDGPLRAITIDPRTQSALASQPMRVSRSFKMKWARAPEVTTAMEPMGVTCDEEEES